MELLAAYTQTGDLEVELRDIETRDLIHTIGEAFGQTSLMRAAEKWAQREGHQIAAWDRSAITHNH
jgi:hypothetical protein